MATDFYNELAAIIENALVATEVDPDAAAAVTADILTVVVKIFGGQTVYLKNGLSGEVALKHQRIADEYDGRNIRELSMKYRMSAVWIKKIVKRGSQ